jgi:hypothetical protein
MAFGKAWLRPEIDQPIYYLHLVIIAAVVFGILDILSTLNLLGFVVGLRMFTWQNILLSVPLLLCGDVVAHSILKLN